MKKYLPIIPIVCYCFTPAFAIENNTEIGTQDENLGQKIYKNDVQDSPNIKYCGLYASNESCENERATDDKRKTHLYLGAGLGGFAINEKINGNYIENINTDITGFGINLNLGVKSSYVRFGLDAFSTIGEMKISKESHNDTITIQDINMVKYAVEVAGIIKCGKKVDLELGLTFGDARFRIEGDWSDRVIPYGGVIGMAINFNEHHALVMSLKGYTYSIHKDSKAIGGEFIVGYRANF